MKLSIHVQATGVISAAVGPGGESIGLSLKHDHSGTPNPFGIIFPAEETPRLIALLSSALAAAQRRAAQERGASLERIHTESETAALRVDSVGAPRTLPQNRQELHLDLGVSSGASSYAMPLSMSRETATALASALVDVLAV